MKKNSKWIHIDIAGPSFKLNDVIKNDDFMKEIKHKRKCIDDIYKSADMLDITVIDEDCNTKIII